MKFTFTTRVELLSLISYDYYSQLINLFWLEDRRWLHTLKSNIIASHLTVQIYVIKSKILGNGSYCYVLAGSVCLYVTLHRGHNISLISSYNLCQAQSHY